MCRLAAVVTSEITEFGLVLKQAPRSLARLSKEHPDGWGIAAYGGLDSIPPSHSVGSYYAGGWRLQRGTERAADCDRFQAIASRSRGTILIAHVRQKTVGPTKIENTHPFVQSGWVFAHNGTIQDQAYVKSKVSEERLAEIRGETDSEVLFAFFLTRFDAAGVGLLHSDESRVIATRVLAEATEELRAKKVGAFNFLLSEGSSCFVHRFGRSLYLLERRPSPDAVSTRDLAPASALGSTSSMRAEQVKRWTERRPAVLFASERVTDEPWHELSEGTLLRVDREPTPTITWAAGTLIERAAS
jgi:predicted glutamine amidotransferase